MFRGCANKGRPETKVYHFYVQCLIHEACTLPVFQQVIFVVLFPPVSVKLVRSTFELKTNLERIGISILS